jgi:hypothetical protein
MPTIVKTGIRTSDSHRAQVPRDDAALNQFLRKAADVALMVQQHVSRAQIRHEVGAGHLCWNV